MNNKLSHYLKLIKEEKDHLWFEFHHSGYDTLVDWDYYLSIEGMYGKLGSLYMIADKIVDNIYYKAVQYENKLVK